MLSLSSKYALRAMICLTQFEDEWPISSERIAERTNVPAKYMSKILGDLARCGILSSTRGKNGGFRLARAPEKIVLYDVLAPFETALVALRTCPFGGLTCSDESPCLGHEKWKKVLQVYVSFLRRTSVRDVALNGRGNPRRAPAARRRRQKQASS